MVIESKVLLKLKFCVRMLNSDDLEGWIAVSVELADGNKAD